MSLVLQGVDGRWWALTIDADGILRQDPTTEPPPPTPTTPPPPVTSPFISRGMKRSEIIEMVKELTEHKADQKINFERLYATGLQKMCQAKPFWWRKKSFSFTTVPGVATYDLGATQDASGNQLPGMLDFEVFATKPIIWVDPNNPTAGFNCLDPVYDSLEIMTSKKVTTQDIPSAYTIEPGTGAIMRLMSTPNGAYEVNGLYWAIPPWLSDDPDDGIPLVPGIYHHVLVSRLKMDVTGYLYGVKSELYAIAQGEYAEGIMLAEARPDFANDKMVQFIPGDEAVASTPGN